MKEILGTYGRRARFYPGAIVGLPLTSFVVVFLVAKPAWWSALSSVLAGSGLSYLMAQAVRFRGGIGEEARWTRWGGKPTTRLLRFAGAPNIVQVERWHRQLQRLFPDEDIPNIDEEARDPKRADQVYDVVVRTLRTLTRGPAYRLVFDENCEYGFRRNLLALKGPAYLIDCVSLLAVATLLVLDATVGLGASVAALLAVSAVDLVLLIVQRFVVNEGWVRSAAEKYANRLLEAVELLSRTTTAPK